MEKLVGLKELRENIDHYVAKVKKGESFVVMRRSKPILKISSPDESDELWETVVDFTKIRKGGVSAKTVLNALRKLNGKR